MSDDMFEKGLAKRKAVLGAEYVEKNLAAADDFTRPFQEAMTAWCWGFGWGDEALDPKTRSLMNLSMIGALGKMTEWEIHLRGAITNGVTKDENPRCHSCHRHLLRCAAVLGMLPCRQKSVGRSGRGISRVGAGLWLVPALFFARFVVAQKAEQAQYAGKKKRAHA